MAEQYQSINQQHVPVDALVEVLFAEPYIIAYRDIVIKLTDTFIEQYSELIPDYDWDILSAIDVFLLDDYEKNEQPNLKKFLTKIPDYQGSSKERILVSDESPYDYTIENWFFFHPDPGTLTQLDNALTSMREQYQSGIPKIPPVNELIPAIQSFSHIDMQAFG